MDTDAFIQQAANFKKLDYDGMSHLIKFISILDESHPWTVMRASELLGWINGGEYDRLIPIKAEKSIGNNTNW
jgi:hypothetical protein